MVDRHINVEDTGKSLAALAESVAAKGTQIVISKGGTPIARLIAEGTQTPAHRARDAHKAVTIPPEFEAADVRNAQLFSAGDVPWRLRELPRRR